MSAAAHSIRPNYYRCNRYLPFTLRLDAYEERERKHLATIAAQAKRIRSSRFTHAAKYDITYAVFTKEGNEYILQETLEVPD